MRITILTLSAMLMAVVTCEAFETGPLEIHGFLSQGYLHSDNNNFYADTEEGTFQFNEFGINFSSDLTDKLRVGLQLLSRDLGRIGNNKVELDWAYGTYRWRDWLKIEAGLLKIVWGFYNDTRDVDMLRTPIFLPQSLYAERNRDIYNSMLGIALGGDFYGSSCGSFSYSFAYGEEDISPDSGLFSSLENIETLEATVSNIFSGNFEWNTPLEGLRVGMDLGQYDWKWKGRLMHAPEDGPPGWLLLEESINDARYLIASVEYSWNDLVLATEYLTVDDSDSQSNTNEQKSQGYEEGRSEGFYGSIAYRFTDHFELGAYYSVTYPDTNDKGGKEFEKQGLPDFYAWQKELVVTTRFDFNEHWLLKLEGHFVNGAAHFVQADNPQGLKEDSFLFAAKTSFSF